MEANVELLKETLKVIKAKPEQYSQETWVSNASYSPCGTTMCFAGHAAVLAGAEIPNPKKHEVYEWYILKDEKNSYINYLQRHNYSWSEYYHVQEFAQKALGLTYEEQEYLFDPNRSVEEIEQAVDELTLHGRILTWEEDDDDEDEYY